MPRKAKGARLYLRRRAGRETIWVIRDGADEHIAIGRDGRRCGESDRGAAEEALGRYIAAKHRPDTSERDSDRLSIATVIAVYLEDVAPDAADSARIADACENLLAFWGARPVSDIRSATCREYTEKRMSQRWRHAKTSGRTIQVGTARRELEALQAALRHYDKQFGITKRPIVTLPQKPDSKTRWLDRSEAAALLGAALGFYRDEEGRIRRRGKPVRVRRKAAARFILIGLYTGTRRTAIFNLHWFPSPVGGNVDLDAGRLYRRGASERRTNKRRGPARLPDRLTAHLRRWHRMDMEETARRIAAGRPAVTHVVHEFGQPIGSVRTAWASIIGDARLSIDVTPHTLRHTTATWLMQRGTNLWEAAGFLSMSVQQLERTYGHHHPDFQSEAAERIGRH